VVSSVLSDDDQLALLLGAVFAVERDQRDTAPVARFAPSGWRNLRVQGQRSIWRAGGRDHCIEHTIHDAGVEVLVGHWPEPGEDGALADDTRSRRSVRLLRRGTEHAIEVDGHRHVVDAIIDGDVVHTYSRAGSISWTRVPRFVHHGAVDAATGPVCPLPGRVLTVHTRSGAIVREGDLLVVVEAMKMEHRIHATGHAIVVQVHVEPGQRVDAGTLVATLEHVDEPADSGA
jgi:propionyl-CoA carboxylase alpha chain